MFGPITVLLGLVAGIGVLVRWRRARGIERQQLTWRVDRHRHRRIALFPLAVPTSVGVFARIDMPFFVLTLALPVLRYRLWSIDTLVRRSVAYAGVIAVCSSASTPRWPGSSPRASPNESAPWWRPWPSPSPSPRCAIGRSDSSTAGSTVTAPIPTGPSATSASASRRSARPTSRPTIVDTVAPSLRLPYAAIEGRDGTVIAASGTPRAGVERWPLSFEGEPSSATSVAAPRAGEESFDGRDRALLADVARHAGVAVHAAALTDDLLASRQRLVTAREEERRRLRRDLHDGLGPLLTAIGLNVDAARAQLDTSPATADELLVDARDGTTQAIDDLRRLVYGLRPPALDELGLVGALRAQATGSSADRRSASPSTSAPCPICPPRSRSPCSGRPSRPSTTPCATAAPATARCASASTAAG